MRVTRVEITGLRAAPDLAGDTPEAVITGGTAPARAYLDALTLVRAALDPRHATEDLATLGLAGPHTTHTVAELGLDAVSTLDPLGVDELVVERDGRHLVIAVELDPGPPLFGLLREHAARDPRLLAPLGVGAPIRLRIGWLFNRACTDAAVSVNGLQIGDEVFSTIRTDRPTWLPSVLGAIGRAIHRVGGAVDAHTLACRWRDAWLAPDPHRRVLAAEARTALAEDPLHLDVVELVARGDTVRLGFGPDLLPLRAVDPSAGWAMSAAHAAFVVRPDVLLVDDPGPPGAVAWWTRRIDGTGATLVQVFAPGAT